MTWLWRQPLGRTDYTADHVNVWAAMVRRHLTIPHRLACVTDMSGGIEAGVEIIPPPRDFEAETIPTWGPDRPQCLRRLALFRPDAARLFGERFVSMDMDCVVAGSLDPLFDRPEDIVLYASPPSTAIEPRPYNGSMVLMNAGARPQVFERFTSEGAIEAGARYAGSDQAWISHVLGAGEATWSEDDGVYWWGRWSEAAPARLMFFPGQPKPWDLLHRHSWVAANYRQDLGGRCLLLGYAPGLWADVEAALDAGAVDAVIASPEAAAHWPGEVLAIASDDAEAARLAAGYGFDEVVWCGRTGEASLCDCLD